MPLSCFGFLLGSSWFLFYVIKLFSILIQEIETEYCYSDSLFRICPSKKFEHLFCKMVVGFVESCSESEVYVMFKAYHSYVLHKLFRLFFIESWYELYILFEYGIKVYSSLSSTSIYYFWVIESLYFFVGELVGGYFFYGFHNISITF